VKMLEDYLNRQELVKEYMPFVRKIAYDLVKSLPPSVSVEDLIQEGALGLIGAVERFDPQRNVKLSTYVMSRIKGAMLDYLRTIDWMPRTLRKQMKAIENKKIELMDLNPQESFENMNEEIAKALDMDSKDVELVEREISRNQVLSLDKYLFDEENEESIVSEDETPKEVFEKIELMDKLQRIIESLTEREKMILSLYYEKDLTFKEIAEVLDVSESRICQIHSTILTKIKGMMKEVI